MKRKDTRELARTGTTLSQIGRRVTEAALIPADYRRLGEGADEVVAMLEDALKQLREEYGVRS